MTFRAKVHACAGKPQVNLPRAPMGATSGWRPADPPRRPVLFVNPRSGDGTAERAGLADRARERGSRPSSSPPARTWPHWPMKPRWPAQTRSGWPAATGRWQSWPPRRPRTGSRSCAFRPGPAAGTRNHFALDLGVDRHDVAGALDAFTGGVERQIDMAEVNARAFLNNVSLGIYGEAVRSPAYRDAKVRTLLATAAAVMGPSTEAPELRLVDDLGASIGISPCACVEQPLRAGSPAGHRHPPGARHRPARHPRPRRTRRQPARSRPGRSAPRLEVMPGAAVHAGVDGEAVDLSPPLRFAVRPGALRVRISSRHPGASPSARPASASPPPARGSQAR